MPTPSADSFAALARSSPWRWSTLRFTVTWPGDPWTDSAVRAWLRRPDALRVESDDGGLLRAERTPAPTVGILGPGAGTTRTLVWASQTDPPALRPDGFVAERPDDPLVTYDDPMHDSYHWVAMLDPAELADGRDHHNGLPAAGPLEYRSLSEVEHHGRAAWEAVVVPTATYEPRCGCCPLLRTREVDHLEYDGRPEYLLAAYAEAFRVRLDLQTGVCVLTDELGGLRPGKGHVLRIEAVDEPMDDALFVQRRREEKGGPADWLEKRGARRAERARRRR